MTLAALLEELKEVDAEEWEEIVDWFGGLKNGLHGKSISPHHDLGQALIQNSIQRACERQEWTWRVFKQTPDNEKSHCGEIGKVAPGYEGYYYEQCHEYCMASIEADYAAEALLAAYIAAVREEAK